MQQPGLDLIDIIHKGAIATYPLILLSIISVAVYWNASDRIKNIGSSTCALRNPPRTHQKGRDLAIAICNETPKVRRSDFLECPGREEAKGSTRRARSLPRRCSETETRTSLDSEDSCQ
jgi:hypothetical protein